MKRTNLIACAMMLTSALAAAQPKAKTAGEWFKEGETQYNLGNFSAAVEAFKQGFTLEPNESKKAVYLGNIAQAYRQAKDCSQAQFFYKRYLALKETDTVKPLEPDKRQEIEDRIKELEDCARQQEAIAKKPPDNIHPDDPTKPKDPKDPKDPIKKDVAIKPDGIGGADTDIRTATASKPSSVIVLRLTGGAAKYSAGDIDLTLGAGAALFAGHPINVGDQLTIELGAGFTFSPVGFKGQAGAARSANFAAIMADLGASYHVNPKIGLRGELGVGLLVMGGLSMSPFTNFAETTGALTTFHVRLGVAADFAITPNLIATVAPFAFSFSPPNDGLNGSIKSITSIDFMAGIGYRI